MPLYYENTRAETTNSAIASCGPACNITCIQNTAKFMDNQYICICMRVSVGECVCVCVIMCIAKHTHTKDKHKIIRAPVRNQRLLLAAALVEKTADPN